MPFEKKSSYYLNEPATDLPSGIGPHELRELELMLKGEKPLAMFSDAVPATIELPEADFEPFVKSGQIVKRVEYLTLGPKEPTFRFLYYALPEETWRIDEMHKINISIHVAQNYDTDRDEWKVGRLLGYRDDDIACFIAHVRKPFKKECS